METPTVVPPEQLVSIIGMKEVEIIYLKGQVQALTQQLQSFEKAQSEKGKKA